MASERMQKAMSLVPLVVLGSVWTLHVLAHTLPPPQEEFDLSQFMGKWYELAVVSTCPYYMKRKRDNPVTVALQLRREASEGKFTMSSATVRNGTCKRSSTDYALTDTPGRFFYHVSKFAADVDTSVVETDYDDFALIFQLSTEEPPGNQTIILKLYSRTADTRPEVLDSFKTLVRKNGVSEAEIIMNQWKGDCSSGDPTVTQ